MRLPDGRPDHIEDYLITVRTGQWFGFSDPDNKMYQEYLAWVAEGNTAEAAD